MEMKCFRPNISFKICTSIFTWKGMGKLLMVRDYAYHVFTGNGESGFDPGEDISHSLAAANTVEPRMTSSNGNIFRVTVPLWGNPPVTDGFPSKRPVTRNCDVFFDLRLNKWPCKQSKWRRFEMPSRSLWHHCNVMLNIVPVSWKYCDAGKRGRWWQ